MRPEAPAIVTRMVLMRFGRKARLGRIPAGPRKADKTVHGMASDIGGQISTKFQTLVSN